MRGGGDGGGVDSHFKRRVKLTARLARATRKDKPCGFLLRRLHPSTSSFVTLLSSGGEDFQPLLDGNWMFTDEALAPPPHGIINIFCLVGVTCARWGDGVVGGGE